MDKKYTCRLGVIRDNRKEREKNLGNLPDDIRAQVLRLPRIWLKRGLLHFRILESED